MGTLIKILLKALLSVSKEIAINKTKRALGKTIAKEIAKQAKRQIGLSKYVKGAKMVYGFFDTYDKKGFVLKRLAHQNRITGKAYDMYLRDRQREWNELAKQIRQAQTKYEQHMLKLFQKRKGISRSEFSEFRDWYLSKLTDKQKQLFGSLFKDELQIIFNSSWILFGVYIPYGRKANYGILGLQLKKGSERNPSGYYQWVRIPKKVWNKLKDDPRGETWWREWYHKNRTNKRYLTIESIYYNNNIKQRKKNDKE